MDTKYKLIGQAQQNLNGLNKIVENFRPFAKINKQEPVALVETAIDVLTNVMKKAGEGAPLAQGESLNKLAALLAGVQVLSDPDVASGLTDPDDVAALKSMQLMTMTPQGAKYMLPVIRWAMVSAKNQVGQWAQKLQQYEQTKDASAISKDLNTLRQKLQMAVAPQKQRLPMQSGTISTVGQMPG